VPRQPCAIKWVPYENLVKISDREESAPRRAAGIAS